jgi:hypothetical protein
VATLARGPEVIGSWSELPTPAWGGDYQYAIAVGERIASFGFGSDGGRPVSTFVLEADRSTWRDAGEAPTEHIEPQLGVAAGDRIVFPSAILDVADARWLSLPADSPHVSQGTAVGDEVVYPAIGMALDARTLLWRRLAEPPSQLSPLLAVTLGASVLATTGQGQWFAYSMLDDTWTEIASGPSASSQGSANDSTALVLSSQDGVWSYDVGDDVWTVDPDRVQPCEGISVGPGIDSTLVVSSPCGSTVAILDEGTWKTLPCPTHSCRLVASGRELYDAQTNRLWSATG